MPDAPSTIVPSTIARCLAPRGRMRPRAGPVALSCAALAVCIATPSFAADVPPPSARVYKCTGRGGVPVYQDAPCAPAEALRDFEQDPADVSVVPLELPRAPATAPWRRAERASRPVKPDKREKPRAGDATERRYLHEGMSEGEVIARVGPPDAVGKGGRRARWSYLPAPGDPQTLTMLRFDDGRLVEVERRVVR